MVKKLPVLRRLEVALAETTSESEKDIVYGLLGNFCERIQDLSKVEDLYEHINHRTFSQIDNDRNVTNGHIQSGREFANYLRNKVTLPMKGEKAYRKKMIEAIDMETEEFKRFYLVNK